MYLGGKGSPKDDAVASPENLFVRKCARSPLCTVRYNELESIEHILFRCDYSIEVWDRSSNIASVGRWLEGIWLSHPEKEVKNTLGKLAIICWGYMVC